MSLDLDDVTVALDGRAVLSNVTLHVAQGERVALLGPSGSGKSTLLRASTGLQPLDSGSVRVDGRDVTSVPTHRRGIGLVFQDAALFPHRSVAGNVGFGLDVAGAAPAVRARRVTEALALVGLEGFEPRDVATLSGGEAQRVALARALAPNPGVLLLDEPLAALDGPLRDRLRDDLRALAETVELTVVHVTHDVDEAFALGDRVAILRAGKLVQVAAPERLWSRPADAWVARFLGMENVEVRGARATITPPEAIRIIAGSDAVVIGAERRGGALYVRLRTHDDRELTALVTTPHPPAAGTPIGLAIDHDRVVEVPRDALSGPG